MAQAISQMNSTENSEFGSYLAGLVGLDRVLPKQFRNKTKTQKLLESYNQTLRGKALKSEEWIKFADYLKVRLAKNTRLEVFIDGPDYIETEALNLEYGTPDKVANPLMRVSAEEFNTDFETKRMFKL